MGAIVFGWHNVVPTRHYPLGPKSVEGFERQVRLIKRLARVQRLSDIGSMLHGGSQVSRRVAALTFDDGYADVLDVIAPVLRRHGVPATFFLVPSYLSGTMRPWWEASETGEESSPMLDWDGARRLRDLGFDIGSHTMTHPRLAELSADEQAAELMESRRVLAAELDMPIETLAYPFGDVGAINDSTLACARDAGYRIAVTSRPGLTQRSRDPMHVPRFFLEPSRALRAFDRIPRHGLGKVKRALRPGAHSSGASPTAST